jgi:hypothetical protein
MYGYKMCLSQHCLHWIFNSFSNCLAVHMYCKTDKNCSKYAKRRSHLWRFQSELQGGRSANKFRKFADLIFYRFALLPQMWQFADLRFAEGNIHFWRFAICGLSIFCWHKVSANQQMHNFPSNKCKLKMLSLKFTVMTTFGFWVSFGQSYVVFHSLKYTYVGN